MMHLQRLILWAIQYTYPTQVPGAFDPALPVKLSYVPTVECWCGQTFPLIPSDVSVATRFTTVPSLLTFSDCYSCKHYFDLHLEKS